MVPVVLALFLAQAADAQDAVSVAGLMRPSAAAIAPEPQLAVSSSYRSSALPTWTLESAPSLNTPISNKRVQLYESSREVAPGQAPRRSPRLSIGFRSEGMRNALQSVGIDAHTCQAPVIRLRARMNDNGDVASTFWVSARCSFR